MKTLNQGEIEHLLVNLDSLIFLEGGILFICLGSQKLTAVYILSREQDLNIDVTKISRFFALVINFINVYLNIDVLQLTKTVVPSKIFATLCLNVFKHRCNENTSFLYSFINFINLYLNIDVTKILHFCTRLLIL